MAVAFFTEAERTTEDTVAMARTSYKRRLIENEIAFRQKNEQIQKGFDLLADIAAADRQQEQIDTNAAKLPLFFYCECSDENCKQRIKITPEQYNQLHKQRDHFVVVPGHEVPSVEHIVYRKTGYNVIQKQAIPPGTVGRLHKTDIHNT
ncbi:MAG TPA: hypothetical protein VLF43_00505 [Candidatus Saccharimonadales bacterium]|nr:hypothetical protein [Candidatus Saccharimonadales bacterium]